MVNSLSGIPDLEIISTNINQAPSSDTLKNIFDQFIMLDQYTQKARDLIYDVRRSGQLVSVFLLHLWVVYLISFLEDVVIIEDIIT